MKSDKVKKLKRMHNDKKFINRRLAILDTWGLYITPFEIRNNITPWWEKTVPGMLRKNNLAQCSCETCTLKYKGKSFKKKRQKFLFSIEMELDANESQEEYSPFYMT